MNTKDEGTELRGRGGKEMFSAINIPPPSNPPPKRYPQPEVRVCKLILAGNLGGCGKKFPRGELIGGSDHA